MCRISQNSFEPPGLGTQRTNIGLGSLERVTALPQQRLPIPMHEHLHKIAVATPQKRKRPAFLQVDLRFTW